jgi:prepilin-type N-terminal cleavage/methylation domain-containing protein
MPTDNSTPRRTASGVHRRFHNIGGLPGFTLVELLVVIGIIALLIALLMPSLTMARRSAQRTACSSKLHQIMLAATMHRNDHADYYPLAGVLPGYLPPDLDDTYCQKYDYFSGTPGSGLQPRELCPISTSLETEMAGSKSLYAANGGIMAVPTETSREAVMLDPRGLTSFFVCPAQAGSPVDIQPQYVMMYCWNSSASSGYVMEPQSYVFNEYVCGWNDTCGYLRGKASLIRQPSKTMFAMDGLGGSTLANHAGTGLAQPMYTVYSTTTTFPVTLADAYNAPKPFGGGPAGDNANFATQRHVGKVNVACDGHVEAKNINTGDLTGVYIAPP